MFSFIQTHSGSFSACPAIPDHLIDPILRTPAKFTLSLRRVRVNDRNVAGTAVINDIRNLDAIHTFKGFYELQNAVALPCSQVIRNQTTVVLDRLKSVHVPSGEVYDVDVVPDAGAIRRIIVVSKKYSFLSLREAPCQIWHLTYNYHSSSSPVIALVLIVNNMVMPTNTTNTTIKPIILTSIGFFEIIVSSQNRPCLFRQ